MFLDFQFIRARELLKSGFHVIAEFQYLTSLVVFPLSKVVRALSRTISAFFVKGEKKRDSFRQRYVEKKKKESKSGEAE